MAAILKLRRGTTASPSLVDGELFLNYTTGTIQFASGSAVSNLLPLDKSITGNVILNGYVSASGDITASNILLSGDLNARNVILSGDIYLGDQSGSDSVYVNASFSGSLLPDTTDVYNIGIENYRYNEIHVVSAFADEATILDITLPSSRILSSSLGDYQDFDTFSGSVDTRFEILNSYTQSTDQRLNSIETFTQSIDNRVNELETTFSSSVDERLDGLEFFSSSEYKFDSASIDLRLDTLEVPFSQSVHLRLSNAEWTGSDHEIRLDSIEGDFSSSVDSRLVNLEYTSSDQEFRLDNLELSQSYFDNTFSGSVDSRLDNIESTGSNHEVRILDLESTGSDHELRITELEFFSSSEYQIDSSSVDLRINYLESSQSYFDNTFSGSVDTRLDNSEWTGSNHESRLDILEGPFSQSVDFRLDSEEAISSDHEIRIDTLETTFSSSVDSRLDELEGPLSSSVNQQLESIHAYTSSLKSSIDTSGNDLIIYGNLTVQGTQTSLNTTETFIEDKTINLASGSLTPAEADGAGIVIDGALQSLTWHNTTYQWEFTGQVSASVFVGNGSGLTDVTASAVYFNDILNKPTLVSGSSQISFNGIVDKPTLFSSSIQVNADTITNFDSNVKDKMNLDSVISGSSQVDLTQTTNYISGIKTRLNTEGVFSSSVQVNADDITNFDSNVEFVINSKNIHSGSYLGTATTSNLDEGVNLYYTTERVQSVIDSNGLISGSTQLEGIFLEINGDGVVSGSSQIDVDQTQNFQPFSSSIDTRVKVLDDISIDHENRINNLEGFSESIDARYLNTDGDGVVSGSSGDQLTSSFDLRYEPISNGSNTLISSSLIQTNEQGSFTSSVNGLSSNIDLGLKITDKPTFENINLPNLLSLPSASEFSVLLYSQSGEITYSELGTAAYYHVSQSIANGDPNTLGNAKAVKDYIDEQLLIIGAGDITSVNAGDGMSGGALSGSATLTLDTGSTHFIDGVNGVVQLGDGVVSGSDQVTQSLDLRYLEINGDNVVSSSVQVITLLGGSGILSSSTETFEQFSASVALDFAGLSTDYNDLENIPSGIVSSSTQISNYNTFLEINGDSVVSGSSQISFNGIVDKPSLVSGSSQIDITQTTNYTSFSSSLDSRLVNQELFSESIDTTIKTKMNLDGVLSGSSQVLAGSGIVSSSEQISNYNVFAELNGDGLVSSSQQISNYNTFLEINGMSVVSGSDQLTGSLVDIESEQTITGTKTFNDIIVNGTGSFAYLQSTQGSAKIIGDSFIILNNDTPTQRYAGIAVQDSGSANTTASLQFDGQTNDWFYQYSDDDGVTTDHGIVLFGPEYSGIGNPTYPTNNTIQKGSGGHHLLDSNITDNGTLITLGSNVQVNGNIALNGTVDGIDLQNFSSSVDGRLDTLEGTSNENPLTFNDTTTIDFSRVGDTITAKAIGGIVSGSSQVKSLLPSGTVSGSSQLTTEFDTRYLNTNGDGVISGSEFSSPSQGTLSAVINGDTQSVDLGLQTSDTVQFAKVGVGGASDATYELKVTGDIGATGDVVAYISSDRRLKDEITPIQNSLQKINSIGGYSFVWNENQHIYKGKDYGVIAQEIEEILPELVETRDNGYKAVKYDRIVSLLIEGIKELSKEVSELKEKIGK